MPDQKIQTGTDHKEMVDSYKEYLRTGDRTELMTALKAGVAAAVAGGAMIGPIGLAALVALGSSYFAGKRGRQEEGASALGDGGSEDGAKVEPERPRSEKAEQVHMTFTPEEARGAAEKPAAEEPGALASRIQSELVETLERLRSKGINARIETEADGTIRVVLLAKGEALPRAGEEEAQDGVD